jgi:hypothetical protein
VWNNSEMERLLNNIRPGTHSEASDESRGQVDFALGGIIFSNSAEHQFVKVCQAE